jgi:AcrR family transcriptional regulator
MRTRLSRAEQNQRNGTLLLAAARRVFLARGYHAATLEQIADEAGFSKGVVYSRFASKADMFLALLAERIEERAAENARLVAASDVGQGIALLREHAGRRNRAERDWGLLLIEFRVHAARDPDLGRRYAAVHDRTLQALAGLLAELYSRAGQPPPLPPDQLARLILTIEVGVRLEEAADPEGPARSVAFELLGRFLEDPPPDGDGPQTARRWT